MPDAAIDENELLRRRWRFVRGDGRVIAERLRLDHDGRLAGYENADETTWQLRDGRLEFANPAGETTTRFGALTLDGNGLLAFTGHVDGPGALSDHVLQEVARPAPIAAPRIAVMVRTHLMSDKLDSILHKLSEGIGYDLYVAADETNGPIRVPAVEVVGHSENLCGQLGLIPALRGHKLLWFFGDYALYCAYSTIPEYDYYVMLEYDVEFVRDNPLFLEGLLRRLVPPDAAPYDFVGTQFFRRPPAWHWYKNCRPVFPDVCGTLFPLVILSRRALEHLMAWRLAEAAREAASPSAVEPIYCEAFLPSLLVADGSFRCADVNELIPAAWDWPSFRIGTPMLMGHLPAIPREVEIVHPVFSEREYIAAGLAQAQKDGKLAEFGAFLTGDAGPAISPDLRANCIAEVSLALSAVK